MGEPGRHRVSILGAERELCCTGCEAVARTIVAGGLERYYETRSSAGLRPEPLPPLECYDDPVAQRQFVAAPSEHAREITLILDRVRCAACLWLNEQVLRRLAGVTRADVNYSTQRAQVSWDPERITLSAILQAIRDIGYEAHPYDPQRQDALEQRERRAALRRLFVAGFGAMQVMMYAFPAYIDGTEGTLSPDAAQLMRWASLIITVPVLFFACGPFFASARNELRNRRIGLDTPIALGLAAGFAASVWATLTASGEVYFDSISMLAFLLLGARYLEAAARRRAARELDPLLRWMPSFALRLRGAEPERVAAHALKEGDLVLVPAGDRIPADGVVERGVTASDESLITGESRPVAKAAGAELVGGALNVEQPVVMRVTRAGADTHAAAIARLVERSAAAKPRLVEGADRVARVLTYVVLATALAAWLYSANVWIAVAVLVVTCPCALALAAPIVLTRVNTALLRAGVVLTRSRAIEALERATDVVLDKTGTLTRGRFVVTQFVALGALGETACLALARSLEAASRHPIARAFPGAPSVPVDSLANVPGQGVEGRVEGRRVRIGGQAFCRELCQSAPPVALASRIATPVYLADESGWLAVFLLEDELRADAGALVATLKAHGLRVHLASGDEPAVVAAVAQALGIRAVQGGMKPRDKADYVERLQASGRVVAMIGDGLNDAPVLARADVSFAMAGGADVAQQQADVVLVGDRLGAVAQVADAAHRAMRLIRQNLAWAAFYNVVALPLAAGGWIGPWEAAIGMGASSLIVLANAMRPFFRIQPWKASTSSSRSRSLSYS